MKKKIVITPYVNPRSNKRTVIIKAGDYLRDEKGRIRTFDERQANLLRMKWAGLNSKLDEPIVAKNIEELRFGTIKLLEIFVHDLLTENKKLRTQLSRYLKNKKPKKRT